MRVPRRVWIVVLSVAALFGAFVLVLREGGGPLMPDWIRVEGEKAKSKDNVRSLLVFLAASHGMSKPLPAYDGKAFLLWYVAANLLDRRDPRMLGLLFSPADTSRSLAKAGGIEAYRDITLESLHQPDPTRDRLTSYAGPRRGGAVPAPAPGAEKEGPPLIADLSFPDGAIVGFVGGTAMWLTREELGLGPNDPIVAGEASKSPILRQLSSE